MFRNVFFILASVTLMSCFNCDEDPVVPPDSSFVCPPNCTEKVTKSGYITDCECWTKDKSPIIIEGDLYISNTGEVIIEQGVDVKFNKDETTTLDENAENISIQCEGKFSALGKKDTIITFTPNSTTPIDDQWGFIALIDSAVGNVEFSNFSYSRYGFVIQDDAYLTMSDCKHEYAFDNDEIQTAAISSFGYSKGDVTRCDITNSEIGVWVGHDSKMIFKNCNINGSLQFNVVASDITKSEFTDCQFNGGKWSVITIDQAKPVINNCLIENANEYGLAVANQSKPIVSNTTIRNNKVGVVCDSSSAGVYTHCSFKDNTFYGAWASVDATPNFVSCMFESNQNYGLYINESAEVSLDSCIFRKNNNEFTASGIYVSGTSKIYATNTCVSENDFGVNLKDGAYGLFYQCEISKNNVLGLQTSDSCSVRVQNSLITDHQRKGFQANNRSRPSYEYCTISNNQDGGGWIQDNVFLTLEHNNILNNQRTSVYNSTSIIQSWPNNWWGTTDTLAIDKLLYDRLHQPKNTVIYKPIANGPYPYPPEVCP
jgi:hypothetical protein